MFDNNGDLAFIYAEILIFKISINSVLDLLQNSLSISDILNTILLQLMIYYYFSACENMTIYYPKYNLKHLFVINGILVQNKLYFFNKLAHNFCLVANLTHQSTCLYWILVSNLGLIDLIVFGFEKSCVLMDISVNNNKYEYLLIYLTKYLIT